MILSNINESEAPKMASKLGYDKYVVKTHATPSKIITAVKEFYKNSLIC